MRKTFKMYLNWSPEIVSGIFYIYITISTFTSVRPYGVVGGVVVGVVVVRPVPSRPVPLPIFIMFRVPEAQSDRC